MRNFILGVIITLLLLFLGGLAIARSAFCQTNAGLDSAEDGEAPGDVRDGRLHGAPRPACNQSRATDRRQSDRRNENLHHELAGCHGNLDNKTQPLSGDPSTPPVPQLIIHPMV